MGTKCEWVRIAVSNGTCTSRTEAYIDGMSPTKAIRRYCFVMALLQKTLKH